MRINVYSIEKSNRDEFSKLVDNHKKMIQKYAKIDEITFFNKKIAAAQNRTAIMAKESYSEAFLPHMNGYNIGLDPAGKVLDSFEFSENFDKITTLNFFIAGAYGFDKDFLTKCDQVISLSKLTFSHKIAKVVLFEQIFRALSIQNNHPYHK
ncbi:MAG: 23S rRNA (pseudouridine(1915)-N(3))-methyltransferase RlmH [Epsilonproteobacteria bacterium]|nr:23S rRNA (pseudouridine(1915)-N(3))-methyltransferase RlmH [Campylobacterota bacterium]